MAGEPWVVLVETIANFGQLTAAAEKAKGVLKSLQAASDAQTAAETKGTLTAAAAHDKDRKAIEGTVAAFAAAKAAAAAAGDAQVKSANAATTAQSANVAMVKNLAKALTEATIAARGLGAAQVKGAADSAAAIKLNTDAIKAQTAAMIAARAAAANANSQIYFGGRQNIEQHLADISRETQLTTLLNRAKQRGFITPQADYAYRQQQYQQLLLWNRAQNMGYTTPEQYLQYLTRQRTEQDALNQTWSRQAQLINVLTDASISRAQALRGEKLGHGAISGSISGLQDQLTQLDQFTATPDIEVTGVSKAISDFKMISDTGNKLDAAVFKPSVSLEGTASVLAEMASLQAKLRSEASAGVTEDVRLRTEGRLPSAMTRGAAALGARNISQHVNTSVSDTGVARAAGEYQALAAAERAEGDAAAGAAVKNKALAAALDSGSKSAQSAYGWMGLLRKEVPLFGTAAIGIGLWHVALDGVIEALAIAVPAATALVARLTAFGAAAAPSVQDIYTHMKNLYEVTQATGKSIYPLSGAFQKVADSVRPQVYQLFGDALVVMNHQGGLFQKLALSTGSVIDKLASRLTVFLTSGGSGFQKFLQEGSHDLGQLGQVAGNVGHAFANLLKAMPGFAHLFLDLGVAASKAVEWISKMPTPLLYAGLGLHGLFVYGGLAVTGLKRVGLAVNDLASRIPGLSGATYTFGKNLGANADQMAKLASRTPAAERAVKAFGDSVGLTQLQFGRMKSAADHAGVSLEEVVRSGDTAKIEALGKDIGLTALQIEAMKGRAAEGASVMSRFGSDLKGVAGEAASMGVLAGAGAKDVEKFAGSAAKGAEKSGLLSKAGSALGGVLGGLTSIPVWGWIAGGLAVVGGLILKFALAKDATAKWISSMEAGLHSIQNVSTGFRVVQTDLTTASDQYHYSTRRVIAAQAAYESQLHRTTAAQSAGKDQIAAANARMAPYINRLQAAKRAQSEWAGETSRLTDAQALMTYRVNQLGHSYGGNRVALGLLVAAGVSEKQMLDKNKQAWLQVQEQVKATSDAYRAMGQRGGILGSDMKTLNYLASEQVQAMQKLNQGWDQFTQIVTGGQTSFDKWALDLKDVSKAARQTGVSFDGLSKNSLQFNQSIEGSITDMNSMFDSLRLANVGQRDYRIAVRDVVAQYLPYTKHNTTLIHQLEALSNGVIPSNIHNYKQLRDWLDKSGTSTRNLHADQAQLKAIIDKATNQVSDETAAWKYQGNVITKDVLGAQAKVIESQTRLISKARAYEQAKLEDKKNSPDYIRAEHNYADAIVKTGDKLHWGRQKTIDYIAKLLQIPKSRATQLYRDEHNAHHQIDAYIKLLRSIPKSITTKQYFEFLPSPLSHAGAVQRNNSLLYPLPKRAAGGPVAGAALVGEQGPEVAIFPAGTQIVPHGAGMPAMQGTGGAMRGYASGTITPLAAFNSDFRQIDALFNRDVETPISRWASHLLPQSFTSSVKNWFSGVWGAFKRDVANPVSNWATKTVEADFNRSVKGWFDSAWGSFKRDVANPISGWVSKSVNADWNRSVRGWFDSVWGSFKRNVINPVTGWIGKSVNNDWNASIRGWFDSVWGTFKRNVINPVTGWIGKSVNNDWNSSIRGWFDSVWGTFKRNVINPMTGWIGKSVNNDWNASIRGWFDSVWSAFRRNVINPVEKWVGSALNSDWNASIRGWFDSVWGTFRRNVIEPVEKWISSTVNNDWNSSIKGWFDSVWGTFKRMVVEPVDKYVTSTLGHEWDGAQRHWFDNVWGTFKRIVAEPLDKYVKNTMLSEWHNTEAHWFDPVWRIFHSKVVDPIGNWFIHVLPKDIENAFKSATNWTITHVINKVITFINDITGKGGGGKIKPVQTLAEGGSVWQRSAGSVSGAGDHDTQPIIAMPGEFVVRKQARMALDREFGPGFMQGFINQADTRMMRTPGKQMASGGQVPAKSNLIAWPTAMAGGGDVSPFGGRHPGRDRIDQGVDYVFTGPIHAINSGRIIGNLGGWPGGPFIEELLDSGEYAGKRVYYSENLSSRVHAGQHVSRGQVIANAHGGLEFGFASGIGSESEARHYGQVKGGTGAGEESTAFGVLFNDWMKSLGVPGGLYHGPPGGKGTGHIPKGWPTAGGLSQLTKKDIKKFFNIFGGAVPISQTQAIKKDKDPDKFWKNVVLPTASALGVSPGAGLVPDMFMLYLSGLKSKFTNLFQGGTGGFSGHGIEAVYTYLLRNVFKGNRVAAAGATASIGGESNWNPESQGTGGRGLIGWTPPGTLPDSAFTGNASKDMAAQLAQIKVFLTRNGDWGAVHAMMRANSVEAAAQIWDQRVERAGINDVHSFNIAKAKHVAGLAAGGAIPDKLTKDESWLNWAIKQIGEAKFPSLTRHHRHHNKRRHQEYLTLLSAQHGLKARMAKVQSAWNDLNTKPLNDKLWSYYHSALEVLKAKLGADKGIRRHEPDRWHTAWKAINDTLAQEGSAAHQWDRSHPHLHGGQRIPQRGLDAAQHFREDLALFKHDLSSESAAFGKLDKLKLDVASTTTKGRGKHRHKVHHPGVSSHTEHRWKATLLTLADAQKQLTDAWSAMGGSGGTAPSEWTEEQWQNLMHAEALLERELHGDNPKGMIGYRAHDYKWDTGGKRVTTGHGKHKRHHRTPRHHHSADPEFGLLTKHGGKDRRQVLTRLGNLIKAGRKLHGDWRGEFGPVHQPGPTVGPGGGTPHGGGSVVVDLSGYIGLPVATPSYAGGGQVDVASLFGGGLAMPRMAAGGDVPNLRMMLGALTGSGGNAAPTRGLSDAATSHIGSQFNAGGITINNPVREKAGDSLTRTVNRMAFLAGRGVA